MPLNKQDLEKYLKMASRLDDTESKFQAKVEEIDGDIAVALDKMGDLEKERQGLIASIAAAGHLASKLRLADLAFPKDPKEVLLSFDLSPLEDHLMSFPLGYEDAWQEAWDGEESDEAGT